VQAARKAAGLQVEDRIELFLDGDHDLIKGAQAHRDYLADETLALDLHIADGKLSADIEYRQDTKIDGLALTIALGRV
jgi:isoleucyl-tRNA synthetase